MATRTRVEAFEAWLRATGTADEIALFSKSYSDGFVAVAGSKRVGLAHVIAAVKLARDAGMDTTAMEKLGHLFVKFTDAGEPQIEDKPPEAVKPPEPEKIKPFEMLPLPPLEPKPVPEPPVVAAVADAPEVPVVAFRKSTQQAPLPKPAAPPPDAVAAPAPEMPAPVRAATEKPAAAAAVAPRKPNRGLAAGAAIAAAVVGLVVWHLHDSSSSGDAPDHLRRIAPLAIDAEFPDGWHLAPDSAAHIGGLGALKTALAARGGTDADPESRAFLAALPLTDSLAAGADITDEALVKAAQSAERGTQSRLLSQGGAYQTGGCTIAAIAAHTAVCRGTVRDGSRTLALQTYVRVGDERAIVALFVSKLSVHDPASEADGIVASLGI
jgi:hypothetical protein